MPIIYRQRTPSFSESDSELENENIPLVPTDADDSIVLSDLVRTGEASRLRRRGAMRLDHGFGGQANPPRVFSPTVIVVGSPTWESDPEESQGGPGFSRERVPRYTRGQPRARRAADECNLDATYTLFCGGDESGSEDDFDSQPCMAYEPSVLPLYSPSSSASSSKIRYPRKPKRSNGCGAILHMSAAPRQRQGNWSAKGNASSAVVSLDECYFDKETASKITRSRCGCIREGVGCAVWYVTIFSCNDVILTSNSLAVTPWAPGLGHAKMQATELSTTGPNQQVLYNPKVQGIGEHMVTRIHTHTRPTPTISLSYPPWSPLTLRIPSPSASPPCARIPPLPQHQHEYLNNHETST
jgi:hypothetical protein